jgi:outer membrane protein OmpA-like peptidoglycan-associated protein
MLRIFFVITLLSNCTSLPHRGEVVLIKTMQQERGGKGENKSDFRYCLTEGDLMSKCPGVTPKTPTVPEVISVSSTENSFGESHGELESPIMKLFFHFDSGEMTPLSQEELKEKMHLLRGKRVLLRGYTDNLGRLKYNQQLALERADKIKQILGENGIGISNGAMEVEGYPLCCYENKNSSENERKKNRRVEVYSSH